MNQGTTVTTTAGPRAVDATGSPLGVVRIDPERSYVGVTSLLQTYIDDADASAWKKIKAKIDYTFENLDLALAPLDEATGFSQAVKARVARGQKLVFKPNLVSLPLMDPETHSVDRGYFACTEWSFVAALMRWFHDRLGISYYQMAVAEAGTEMPEIAGYWSRFGPEGRVTPEAVIEGKVGNLYAGWGFYFVRQYLAERLGPGQSDDPRRGYEESVAGTYLPPGLAGDRLMAYDLNRIGDESQGREVPVPEGENFQSIILHKVIVGGDPNDAADRQAYPGCVLVNVPWLKVHTSELVTNAIKNLGIGLYSMEIARGGQQQWPYAYPRQALPGVKGGIPHAKWVAEPDPDTGLPQRDAAGNVILRKTGGMRATMVDVIQAVRNQDIYILHVADAIETINFDHSGGGRREQEGLVVAGLDPVALDLLCARYVIANIPMAEAEQSGLEDGLGGQFAQKVPVPVVEGDTIITRPGYDCAIARDGKYAYAEKRGLGQRSYHVVGRDTVRNLPLASVRGHLGTVAGGAFADLITPVLYYGIRKFIHDWQRTCLGYLDAVDRLTGSALKSEFLDAYDENGDGVVTYEEQATRNGRGALGMYMVALTGSLKGTHRFGHLLGPFLATANPLRYRKAAWNPDGLELFESTRHGGICLTAYLMSTKDVEAPDPFLPSLTWGQGKWPSFECASYIQLGSSLYGSGFPLKVGLGGLYGLAFRYADATQNQSGYAGKLIKQPHPEAIDRYLAEVASGEAQPLDFVLYVPAGYDTVGGLKVPNVEETEDPARLFTASFAGGTEVWPPAKPGALAREATAVGVR